MHLIVVGLSHRTAPVEQREKAALTDTAARAVMRTMVAIDGVSEAVAISTCNRTEVYVRADDNALAEEAICAAVVEHTEIGRHELDCARYAHRDDKLAAHLLRVAASLDAMVVGESEIQGQVRQAFERAQEEGTVGPVLDNLFRKALETGKRVRHETGIGAGAVSVASVAVELAREAVTDLTDRRVLLIGAGEVAEATASALVDSGVGELVVANRTSSTARGLAGRIGGEGVGFDRLPAELVAADIVISSTDAPHPLLGHDDIERAMRERPGRPMVLIDIAVPRDLEAEIASVPGVRLYDIDDLERVVEMNLNGRMREADLAETIVRDEAARFVEWRRALSVAPTIGSLRDMAEQIRTAEVARAAGQWESMTDADRERVDQLTKAIINKLLHEPTVRLRAAVAEGDGVAHLESIRHLFGVESDQST
jgi:glutamyl-tRNA reductase